MLDERRNYTVPHFDEWADSCHHSVLVIFLEWIKADAGVFSSSFPCKCLLIVPIYCAT